jgi:hypothetical protein
MSRASSLNIQLLERRIARRWSHSAGIEGKG